MTWKTPYLKKKHDKIQQLGTIIDFLNLFSNFVYTEPIMTNIKSIITNIDTQITEMQPILW